MTRLATVVLATSLAFAAAPRQDRWIPLFNEQPRRLDVKIKGYDAGDNFADTFRVEDGVLKVSLRQVRRSSSGKFGHLFYKDKFSHYVLRVEYRFVGEQAQGRPGLGASATAA